MSTYTHFCRSFSLSFFLPSFYETSLTSRVLQTCHFLSRELHVQSVITDLGKLKPWNEASTDDYEFQRHMHF